MLIRTVSIAIDRPTRFLECKIQQVSVRLISISDNGIYHHAFLTSLSCFLRYIVIRPAKQVSPLDSAKYPRMRQKGGKRTLPIFVRCEIYARLRTWPCIQYGVTILITIEDRYARDRVTIQDEAIAGRYAFRSLFPSRRSNTLLQVLLLELR